MAPVTINSPTRPAVLTISGSTATLTARDAHMTNVELMNFTTDSIQRVGSRTITSRELGNEKVMQAVGFGVGIGVVIAIGTLFNILNQPMGRPFELGGFLIVAACAIGVCAAGGGIVGLFRSAAVTPSEQVEYTLYSANECKLAFRVEGREANMVREVFRQTGWKFSGS